MVARALAAGCWMFAAAAVAHEPASTHTRVSANGLYGIRLLDLGGGKCRVEVVKDQDLAWSLDKCVGSVDDEYFISSDGQHFWVLYTLPAIPAKRAVRRHGRHRPSKDSVLDAVVAALFSKDGSLVEQKRLGAFVKPKKVDHLRELDKHFGWLTGTAGIPGRGPRLNDKNEVEFETVDGDTTHRLSL